MGLTKKSTGINAADSELKIVKLSENDIVVALAGNPNVGKSTVFNALTGMKQHTGNWPGKTVSNAVGYCKSNERGYLFVDLPGTYSLMSHSAEEDVARNFICFGKHDIVAVVCDATVLERNLNLVLQIAEITPNFIVCVNLLDEAKRKGISVDLKELSGRLGVSVVGTVAQNKKTLTSLLNTLDFTTFKKETRANTVMVNYSEEIETAITIIEPIVSQKQNLLNSRWLSLKLLEGDDDLLSSLYEHLGEDFSNDIALNNALKTALKYLEAKNITGSLFKDLIVTATIKKAEELCNGVVTYSNKEYSAADRKIDRILTGKFTGFPLMLLLLAVIFWITIVGANYPSSLLQLLFSKGEIVLATLFEILNLPQQIINFLIDGVYGVLTWVVSVMLPPMAIFFPLFTILEDSGYLPRIAYNLDKPFKKCNACGKQALTMSMGFGCNAAGVIGCRIIDSPRERLLAILTNSFVPCNGKFPSIITIISLFFLGVASGVYRTLLSALFLTAVIIIGVAATFLVTYLLSKTLLKGTPSSYILELPPYRKPQIWRVLIRSIFDRTAFVLSRAVAVAAPAGAVIWLLANIHLKDQSLLHHAAEFLEPLGRFMGLDGVILIAFILGFPANEIVIPLMIMAYTSMSSVTDIADHTLLKQIFVDNGWTVTTAICTVIFSLLHWPCSTTLLTIKKETLGLKWTLLAAAIPTALGAALCIIINLLSKFFI